MDDEARHRALLAAGQAALNEGRFDDARAAAQAVFAFAPGSVGAMWLWLTAGPVQTGDAVFARIEAAAKLDQPAALASQLFFMLGKGYDDMGRVAAAFAAFVEANRLKARTVDPAATRALAEALVAAWAGAPEPLGPSPVPLVFVLGMPRSGTSLMAQMLGGHPGVTNLGEQLALGAALGAPEPLGFARALDRDGLAAARAAYLAAIGAAAHPGQVLVDKMPENYWFAGLIPLLFPDALIVHMRRPRLATCWSCFRNDFRDGHAYSNDFAALLAQHDTHLALCEAGRAAAGGRWREVELEALAADPRAVLAPVLAALGLGWDAACLAPEAGGGMATLSKWQLRQGIDPAMPRGWRAYLPLIRQRWGVDG